MKIPVRPAPLPPSTNRNMSLHLSSSAVDDWGDGRSKQTANRPLSLHASRLPGEKKKPPPRPPPPKFATKTQQKQVPNRPSSLLSGLFNRNVSSRSALSQHSLSTQQKVLKKETRATTATASLIDLHSPSCSPTPTRSSSDGLSVNSFGSDGSMSNNGQTPGGGSSSLFESGFEDDFDFFGGLSSSSSYGTPLGEQRDPWTFIQPQDPFSPPSQQNSFISGGPIQKETGSTKFHEQNSVSSSITVKTSSVTSMPTIIRAKPGRPPTLPKLCEATSDNKPSGISLFPVTPISSFATSQDYSHFMSNAEFNDDTGNWSPPMPSIPPPPPPPDVLHDVETNTPPPELPPRPLQLQMEQLKKPYGIAIYDYPATHPDDLSFLANDTIFLLRQVNADWFYGQVGHNQGMFPTNFIKVVIPFNDSILQQAQRSPAQIATALYSFTAETWDDLEFQEGSSIYILSRMNNDWLYGECDGKYGQFPASFVDHIPSNLPLRTD